MGSQQEIFSDLLSLQGKNIRVALQSSGERLEGKLVNTMFDSFLIEVAGSRRVIRFEDLMFLDKAN